MDLPQQSYVIMPQNLKGLVLTSFLIEQLDTGLRKRNQQTIWWDHIVFIQGYSYD